MAIIYGRPAAERDLLNIAPDSVKKFEDVEFIHEQLRDKLFFTKKEFLNKVPQKITEEEQKLEKIKSDEKKTHQKFDEKIRILEDKKAKGGFSKISASLKISITKNYTKRKEIKKIKKLEQIQHEQLTEWKEKPEQIFNREQKDTIEEANQLKSIKSGITMRGAKGEVQVLKKLSELSDDYYVLCGINAELPNYVRYKGRRNLRTAQIDFLVISKKGVILIEAKNWSNKFYRESNNFSPHEQADRAGRVLWIAINSRWGGWWSSKSPSVTTVVLSIQGNMRNDRNFKFVNVCDLTSINRFIENRKEKISEKEVKKVVNMLKDHMTN